MSDQSAVPTAPSDQQIRLGIAREIVAIFLPERLVYMSLSAVTAALVIYVSFQVIHDSSKQVAAAGTLLGSGGIVAFNLARLLTMFDTVIERVFGPK
jgi:hypothetical protein